MDSYEYRTYSKIKIFQEKSIRDYHWKRNHSRVEFKNRRVKFKKNVQKYLVIYHKYLFSPRMLFCIIGRTNKREWVIHRKILAWQFILLLVLLLRQIFKDSSSLFLFLDAEFVSGRLPLHKSTCILTFFHKCLSSLKMNVSNSD